MKSEMAAVLSISTDLVRRRQYCLCQEKPLFPARTKDSKGRSASQSRSCGCVVAPEPMITRAWQSREPILYVVAATTSCGDVVFESVSDRSCEGCEGSGMLMVLVMVRLAHKAHGGGVKKS